MFQVMSIGNENIAINVSCTKQKCDGEKTICCDCKYVKIDAVGIDAIMLLRLIRESPEKENRNG